MYHMFTLGMTIYRTKDFMKNYLVLVERYSYLYKEVVRKISGEY